MLKESSKALYSIRLSIERLFFTFFNYRFCILIIKFIKKSKRILTFRDSLNKKYIFLAMKDDRMGIRIVEVHVDIQLLLNKPVYSSYIYDNIC